VTDPFFTLKGDPGAAADEVVGWFRGGPTARSKVPDLVGMGARDASAAVARLGFVVRTVRLTEDPEPVEGTVVRQEPGPGTKLRRGRDVTLYLSFPERQT
jgi:beta-lactam-binding protein with PASTA domain